MKMVINNHEYEVKRNVGEAIDVEEIANCLTDYFDDFDFILGDYAYGKLRLKGFNTTENKNFKPYNDIATLDTYIKEHCAYGCRHFVISRIKS